MGLLDGILGLAGQMLGGQSNNAHSGLMNLALSMLNNSSAQGGLAGLLEKFQAAGLGDQIQSWISTDQNQPISSSQLQTALGSETVQNFAQQLGISSEQVSSQLAQLLPTLVDKLTPQGQLPEGGIGNAAELLGGLLGQRGQSPSL